MKHKFILEFDDAPALVFVQRNARGSIEIYQDGKKLNGVRSIEIDAEVGEPTSHRVEYITGCTSKA